MKNQTTTFINNLSASLEFNFDSDGSCVTSSNIQGNIMQGVNGYFIPPGGKGSATIGNCVRAIAFQYDGLLNVGFSNGVLASEQGINVIIDSNANTVTFNWTS